MNLHSPELFQEHSGESKFTVPLQTVRPRLLKLVYFDAGGGHRSAALALRDVIREHYPHWQVELINLLSDILRPLDPVYRLTRNYRTEDVYNGILKSGMTYGFPIVLRGMHRLIKYYSPSIENLLRQHWRKNQIPDLVVSLTPHFNGAMFQTLRHIYPAAPFATVMTDIADCPPHFWQERQDQFIICGSDKAARQARSMGYRRERIFKTSGMILKPQFYQDSPLENRGDERIKLGLDPDLPTALIMFGGHGARTAAKIVTRLARLKPRVQFIVMCGHNEKLRQKLIGRKFCHAVGFTDNVPTYMRLADFFIGKPGPGSLSEALHMGLPVIIEQSARTMPQERYNARWVKRHDIGIVIPSFTHIAKAVRLLLKDKRLEQLHRNTRQFKNYAVYEIPELFEKIMG